MTGLIFDIKEFALYDGPGIRTTVFFKGCPLRCKWCHNPEGLSPDPQMMAALGRCTHCGRCISVCPHKGMHCTLCEKCISACPLHLRKVCGTRWEAASLAEYLLKDADFLRNSQGGITFSGGEPLLQHSFLLELCQLLSPLHKCIETSGYCSPHIFNAVAEELDYIIFDFKIADCAKHRRYTGVDNHVILGNLAYLKQSNKPFTVRIPVIPGVNDGDDDYKAAARILSGARSLERVELLPYHVTAGAKYPMVRRIYNPDFNVDSQPRINKEMFQQYQIPVIQL